MWICDKVISSIIGYESTNRVNYSLLHELYYYEPGGTSAKNLIHWMQVIIEKKLAHFDYGETQNIKVYNSTSPPNYNLEAFKSYKIKTFLVFSDQDPYVTKEDVADLNTLLNNTSNLSILKVHNFNHLDYLWSIDAKTEIYDHMIDFYRRNVNI